MHTWPHGTETKHGIRVINGAGQGEWTDGEGLNSQAACNMPGTGIVAHEEGGSRDEVNHLQRARLPRQRERPESDIFAQLLAERLIRFTAKNDTYKSVFQEELLADFKEAIDGPHATGIGGSWR